MYPVKFKKEVALFANNHSKKFISKAFNIARKRILDWEQCINLTGKYYSFNDLLQFSA
jgi:hypothetical protein